MLTILAPDDRGAQKRRKTKNIRKILNWEYIPLPSLLDLHKSQSFCESILGKQTLQQQDDPGNNQKSERRWSVYGGERVSPRLCPVAKTPSRSLMTTTYHHQVI
jgi:hypothetical protein